MKKYILFAMALVLSVNIFAGCAPSSTHKEVKAEIETFLTSESNQEIIGGDFYYSSKIETQISGGTDFAVLDKLELLVNMSLNNTRNTYQSFTISPLNNDKKEGEKCGAAVTKLRDAQKQYGKFLKAKDSFVENLEYLDVNGIGAKAELDIMEKELGKLVVK